MFRQQSMLLSESFAFDLPSRHAWDLDSKRRILIPLNHVHLQVLLLLGLAISQDAQTRDLHICVLRAIPNRASNSSVQFDDCSARCLAKPSPSWGGAG